MSGNVPLLVLFKVIHPFVAEDITLGHSWNKEPIIIPFWCINFNEHGLIPLQLLLCRLDIPRQRNCYRNLKCITGIWVTHTYLRSCGHSVNWLARTFRWRWAIVMVGIRGILCSMVNGVLWMRPWRIAISWLNKGLDQSENLFLMIPIGRNLGDPSICWSWTNNDLNLTFFEKSCSKNITSCEMTILPLIGL